MSPENHIDRRPAKLGRFIRRVLPALVLFSFFLVACEQPLAHATEASIPEASYPTLSSREAQEVSPELDYQFIIWTQCATAYDQIERMDPIPPEEQPTPEISKIQEKSEAQIQNLVQQETTKEYDSVSAAIRSLSQSTFRVTVSTSAGASSQTATLTEKGILTSNHFPSSDIPMLEAFKNEPHSPVEISVLNPETGEVEPILTTTVDKCVTAIAHNADDNGKPYLLFSLFTTEEDLTKYNILPYPGQVGLECDSEHRPINLPSEVSIFGFSHGYLPALTTASSPHENFGYLMNGPYAKNILWNPDTAQINGTSGGPWIAGTKVEEFPPIIAVSNVLSGLGGDVGDYEVGSNFLTCADQLMDLTP